MHLLEADLQAMIVLYVNHKRFTQDKNIPFLYFKTLFVVAERHRVIYQQQIYYYTFYWVVSALGYTHI